MKQLRTKLLILADDLTGALDSGVQFTTKGDQVYIRVDHENALEDTDKADVLVVNTETRHIPSDEAYRIIYELVREAIDAGITGIYKKTDSGLRGNVGAELTAVLDAAQADRLAFIPAWPAMGRTTKDGIHYVNGERLAESIFAKDVIDPVKDSLITDLIHRQTDAEVTLHGSSSEEKGIVVYDCTDDRQLAELAKEICSTHDKILLAAGCAGLLEKFPRQSEGKTADAPETGLDKDLLVLSGSMNDITRKQLENAERNGSLRVHVPMEKIVSDSWSNAEIQKFARTFLQEADTPVAVIDTMAPFVKPDIRHEELAAKIACAMGRTARCLLEEGSARTFMIIGGDTLLGFIRELGITALRPICEIAPGIVLAGYTHNGKNHCLITKSGAFGTEDQLTEIQQKLQEDRYDIGKVQH
ncbi:MAG: four-carbon acid sugar kinase family protein [Solobacterium sp.]|nr:four-carbon acid sugar kinase family protein [Solobacterium sp.]